MSSLKCSHCGLVNFTHAAQCKRCQNSLGKSVGSAQFQNFQAPPPPQFYENAGIQSGLEIEQKPHCVKCGNTRNVSFQSFKKIYNSPVALMGIFLGVLPYLLFALLLRTTHHLSAPFCEDCWSKFKSADTFESLYKIGVFALMIFSIFAAIAYSSLWLVGIGFAVAFALYFYGNTYIKKVSPKFKKVDAKQVIIEAPSVGEILFTK